MTDRSFDTAVAIHGIIRHAFDRATVSVDRFTALARGALVLYHVNRELYARLKELEALAASWSGNPGAHPVIQRVRRALVACRADEGVDPFLRMVARDLADR